MRALHQLPLPTSLVPSFLSGQSPRLTPLSGRSYFPFHIIQLSKLVPSLITTMEIKAQGWGGGVPSFCLTTLCQMHLAWPPLCQDMG